MNPREFLPRPESARQKARKRARRDREILREGLDSARASGRERGFAAAWDRRYAGRRIDWMRVAARRSGSTQPDGQPLAEIVFRSAARGSRSPRRGQTRVGDPRGADEGPAGPPAPSSGSSRGGAALPRGGDDPGRSERLDPRRDKADEHPCPLAHSASALDGARAIAARIDDCGAILPAHCDGCGGFVTLRVYCHTPACLACSLHERDRVYAGRVGRDAVPLRDSFAAQLALGERGWSVTLTLAPGTVNRSVEAAMMSSDPARSLRVDLWAALDHARTDFVWRVLRAHPGAWLWWAEQPGDDHGRRPHLHAVVVLPGVRGVGAVRAAVRRAWHAGMIDVAAKPVRTLAGLHRCITHALVRPELWSGDAGIRDLAILHHRHKSGAAGTARGKAARDLICRVSGRDGRPRRYVRILAAADTRPRAGVLLAPPRPRQRRGCPECGHSRHVHAVGCRECREVWLAMIHGELTIGGARDWMCGLCAARLAEYLATRTRVPVSHEARPPPPRPSPTQCAAPAA